MTQTERTQHTDGVRGVEQGDKVTLTTAGGTEIHAECTSRETIHSDARDAAIYERKTWTFRSDDGKTFRVGIRDGISPYPDSSDAYPSHFPARYPDPDECEDLDSGEAVIGYFKEVVIE